MPTPGITKSAYNALGFLAKFPWLDQFYLAGGTALALQETHRLSYDLDFFSESEFDQKEINLNLYQNPGYKLDRLAKNTILGMIRDTKISFFTYKYQLISPVVNYERVKLAGLADITAMKIDAIGGRGTKRDFIDLYFLSKKYSLDECVEFYLEKYPNVEGNLFHIIKSLGYFDDAENSPQQLKMLKPVSWKEVKIFFEAESARLAKKYLS